MIKNCRKISMLLGIVSTVIFSACTKDDWQNGPDFPEEPGMGQPGEGWGGDDSSIPSFNPVIEPWNGEKADDAANDKVDSSNEDIYHEANSFSEKVIVMFNGSTATVIANANSKIKYVTDGAYVTIDMLTNSVKNVEIIASGKSDDGQLKIYGEKKFKLTLDDLELTSLKGPAINDQCKKRVFVHLADGSVNKLTDCESYSKEPYYLTASGETDEDRKDVSSVKEI